MLAVAAADLRNKHRTLNRTCDADTAIRRAFSHAACRTDRIEGSPANRTNTLRDGRSIRSVPTAHAHSKIPQCDPAQTPTGAASTMTAINP
jgi:hypothetical protein